MKTQLLIIGAGPAGLMAAIKAADEGIKCTVLESVHKPARKLGISGKGRGNITNTAPYKEFLEHFNNHGRFLKTSFKSFFNQDLIAFFAREGMETVVERGGRVFTASGKAPEIVSRLIKAANKRGVKILSESPATELLITDGKCVGARTADKEFHAEAVIIATGGKSYPQTGSTGDGYKFAQKVGHSIITPLPSLVGLKPSQRFSPRLEGLQLKNVDAKLIVNGKKLADEFGEMTFLDGHLAGPIIITLSRLAVPCLAQRDQVSISIDLKPGLSHEKTTKRILRDIESYKSESCERLIGGLLPSSLVPVCLKACAISPDVKCADLDGEQIKKIRNWLKELTFKISVPGPWSHAIVTSGGIKTNEISPTTMESKLVKNLFFAGEVIDIDADTGGYNLQAAFSTGWLAGKSSADKINLSSNKTLES